MKRLFVIFCMAFVLPQAGALAHQENHVHSQWVKQQLHQMQKTIEQLKAQIGQSGKQGLGSARPSSSGNMVLLDEKCGAGQQKLCQKSCAAGWKIANAGCIGSGNIGKTLNTKGTVSCYCYDKNDPNCAIMGVTATCSR